METTRLSNKYLHTLEHIFQHPTPHTLEWHDVIALVEHLGAVKEGDKGHLTLTLNGITQDFHRSQNKEVSEITQVQALRDFLERAGIGKSGVIATEAIDSAPKSRFLVVVSQKETLVFRSEEKGSEPERLHPADPHRVLHHQDHSAGGDISSRLPENRTYYKAIAETLPGAGEILLMGHGTAGGSAMGHLEDFLATHHPEIAKKVVGTLTRDVEALTEGQLLQEARAFFMERDGPDNQ